MSEAIKFVLLLIGAYLLGSIPLAYFIGKWARGIDLRKYGSGNVGMTNLMTTTSVWLGIPVLIFDLGKGALAVYAARWLGLPLYMQSIVGLGAIIGHNWPVFLNFNAGRGVLTTVGVALAFEPLMTVILVVIAFIGIPFHQLPITALFSIFLVPVTFWFSTAPVLNTLCTYPLGDGRLAVTLVFFVIFLLVPIRRLTVPLSSLSKTVSRRELLVNRFLFDRDIRNRKAWISQSPHNPVSENEKGQAK
jgi:acyl phosphate:glycerol-3-phosphate acyltransferase